MADTLPPVVARLIADTAGFVRSMAEARAAAEAALHGIRDASARDLPRFAGDLRDVERELPRFSGDLRDAGAGLPRFSGDLHKAGTELPRFAGDLHAAGAGLPQFSGELGDAGKALRGLAADAEQSSTSARDSLDRLASGVERDAARATRASGRTRLIMGALFGSITAGAPIAGAALTVGLGAGFIGLAAIAQHNNQQVQDSFDALKTDVVTQTKAMTAGLVGPMTQAMGQMQSTFDQIAPQLGQVFDSLGGDITQLGSGVDQFATGIMPGLVDIMSHSQVVFSGFATMLGDVGSGLGSMFSALAPHSQEAAASLRSLGSAVHDLLGLAGKLMGALSGVSSFALKLASGGIHALTTATDGLLSVIQPVSDALGSLGSLMGAQHSIWSQLAGDGVLMAASWKLLPKALAPVGGLIGKAGGAASRLSTTLGAGIGRVGEFAGALSGPAALAITGAVLGLGYLESAHQSNATSAQQDANAQAAFGKALQNTGGVATQATAQVIANQLAAEQLGTDYKNTSQGMSTYADAAQKAGQTTSQVAWAVQGTDAQYKAWHDSLNNTMHALDKQAVSAKGVTDAQYAQDTAIAALLPKTDELHKLWKQAEIQQRKNASAMSDTSSTLTNLTGNVHVSSDAISAFGKDLSKLSSDASTAKQSAKALAQALGLLTGHSQSLTNAEEAFNKAIAASNKTINAAKNHTQGWGQELVSANDRINTASRNGQTLNDDLNQLMTTMEGNAAAAYKYAVAHGHASEASQKAGDVAAAARRQFIKEAESFGIGADEAKRMADAAGLIPSTVAIQFAANGDQKVEQSLMKIQGQLRGIPADKALRITAPTKKVQAALAKLGYTIVSLPNGKVAIYGNTTPLEKALHQGLASVNRSTGTITLDANAVPAYNKNNKLIGYVDGSVGTTTTKSNTAPAYSATGQFLGYVNNAWAWNHVGSDVNPAYSDTGQLLGWISRQGAAVDVQAATGSAQWELNRFIINNSGRYISVYVRTVGGGLAGGHRFYSRGGVVHASEGLVLPGYAPRQDTVPAMLSPGESVNVPELTRILGPSRIMAANAAAIAGRPAAATAALTDVHAGSPRGGASHVTVIVQGNVTTERQLIDAVQQGMLEVGSRRPSSYQQGRR